MVIVDQLRISDNSSIMYLDAHVNESEFFENVFIKKITICTENQVLETSPYSYGEDFIYQEEVGDIQDAIKEVHRTLSPVMMNEKYSDSTFSGHMFFVYIECCGTPSPDTPCGLDYEVTLSVVFDDNDFYNKAMSYVRELADTCNIPKGFIDSILNYRAIEMSINSGHYIAAKKFWENLSEFNKSNKNVKPCGCRG